MNKMEFWKVRGGSSMLMGWRGCGRGGAWQNEVGPQPGEASGLCRKPESHSNDSHPCRKERINTRDSYKGPKCILLAEEIMAILTSPFGSLAVTNFPMVSVCYW